MSSKPPRQDPVEKKFLELLLDNDYSQETILKMSQMSREQKLEFIEGDQIAETNTPDPTYFFEKIKKSLSDENVRALKTILKTCKISWIRLFLMHDGLKFLFQLLTDFGDECMINKLAQKRFLVLQEIIQRIRILANVRICRPHFAAHPEFIAPMLSVIYPQEVVLTTDILAVTCVFIPANNFYRFVLDNIEAQTRGKLKGWEIMADYLSYVLNIRHNKNFNQNEAGAIQSDAIRVFFVFLGAVLKSTTDIKQYTALLLNLHKSQVLTQLAFIKDHQHDVQIMIEEARSIEQLFPKKHLNPFDIRQITDFVNETMREDCLMTLNLHFASLIQSSSEIAEKVFTYIENFLFYYRQLVAIGSEEKMDEAAYYALHPGEVPELTLPTIISEVYEKYGFLGNDVLRSIPLPSVSFDNLEDDSQDALKIRVSGLHEELTMVREHLRNIMNEESSNSLTKQNLVDEIERLKRQIPEDGEDIAKLRDIIDENNRNIYELQLKLKDYEKENEDLKSGRRFGSNSIASGPLSGLNLSPLSINPPSSFEPGSPMKDMAPPPPPPPPSMGDVIKNDGKPNVAPPIKMRAFFWQKINRQMEKGTIWEDMKDFTDFDTRKLQEYYCMKVKVVKKLNKFLQMKKEAEKMVEILEANRARSVNIMLSRFKIKNEDIATAILQLRFNRVFTDDQFAALYACRPKPEEMQAIMAYTGDKKLLGTAEKYYLALSVINDFDEHLSFMNISHNFESTQEQIQGPLKLLKNSLFAIKSSENLRNMLRLLLSCGNFMNGGTNRGGAYGYKIKSIADLVYVRSTIPGITFMHILVWLVLDTPDFNNFGQFTNELKDVSTAQKIDIDVLRGSIIELRTQMEKFKSIKLPSKERIVDGDLFYLKFIDFEPKATPFIEGVEKELNEVEKMYTECLKMFGESPIDYNLTTFLEVFAKFTTQFQTVMDNEIKARQKAAEKQEETPDKKEIEEPVMPAKQDHTQQRGILEEDLTQLGNISKAQTEIVRTSRARTSRLQKILSSYT